MYPKTWKPHNIKTYNKIIAFFFYQLAHLLSYLLWKYLQKLFKSKKLSKKFNLYIGHTFFLKWKYFMLFLRFKICLTRRSIGDIQVKNIFIFRYLIQTAKKMSIRIKHTRKKLCLKPYHNLLQQFFIDIFICSNIIN